MNYNLLFNNLIFLLRQKQNLIFVFSYRILNRNEIRGVSIRDRELNFPSKHSTRPGEIWIRK